MLDPKLRLKSNRIESIERRHPWVFSGALVQADTEGLLAGTLVELTTYEGTFLARGYYEKGSIAVRILSFEQNEQIDALFWKNRLAKAKEMRAILGLTSAYRLVNAEGDQLSGLIIDVYGGVAVVQSHTIGIHHQLKSITQALVEVYGSALKAIYYKPELEELRLYEGVLYGTLPSSEEAWVVNEGTIKFLPDVKKGQKTGYFLDQRESRTLVRQQAKGHRVLNMFCYTGGFSLAALYGGATLVTSVDSSARAIQLVEQNLALNFPNSTIATQHESIIADGFKYLKELEIGKYDMIILDPPAFAKRRSVLKNALQGYRKINADALRAIAPGGLLFTFSCSQVVSVEHFRQSIFTAALQAGRQVRVLQQLGQAPDHPVSIFHPEGEYLKGLMLYVE